jgi:hypothetical protein
LQNTTLTKEKINIFGGKATIKQNKFGMWQFRMWVRAEKRYVEKTLGTKIKTNAIELAETMYLRLSADIDKGRTLFSPTVSQAVKRYESEREKDVRVVNITEGRLKTIKSHLAHFVEYVGEKEKIGNLGINTLVKYEIKHKETNYLLFRTEQGAAKQTIRNEMATINACQRFLYEIEQLTQHPRFRLPQLNMTKGEEGKSGEQIKRVTFTHDEWKSFYTALRAYKSKANNRLTDDEYVQRELIRHWCLFGANSALRSGEQRQLLWSDVTIEKDEGLVLARLVIREETSKVRKERVFYTQGGEYLQRWKAIQKEYGVSTKGLVFSADGEREYERWRLHRHWKQVMMLTNIDADKQARLVPYSLRHLAITNFVLSGNTLSDVAFTCGTSVKQIESVYYHLREEKMRSVASARFVRKNGKIFPIAKKIVG